MSKMAHRSSSTSRAPQSLEASLDEENREVLASLHLTRTASPEIRHGHRTATPPATRRGGMLDVERSPSASPRHGSIPSLPLGLSSFRSDPASKLDPTDPSTWTKTHSSKLNSPVLEKKTTVTRPRGVSDANLTSEHVGLKTAENRSEGSSSGPTDATSPLCRHNSTTATGKHSKSPSGRITNPSVSSDGLLSPGIVAKASGATHDSGPHGRLSEKSNSFSTAADDSEDAEARVPIDQGVEEDALDSSDDGGSSGSEDEARGRSRYPGTVPGDKADTSQSSVDGGSQPVSNQQRVPHSQVIKSLLEPSIRVTSPSGDGAHSTHPTGQSHLKGRRPSNSTAMSDDAEASAIAKAKSLALNISPLDTKVPDRHVRMIVRGDWARIHAESESTGKTVRTYLACTDLSQEATYALEWTVGTIMRDGDTLLAIYSIEDETSSSPAGIGTKSLELDKEQLTLAGAQAGKEASDTMESLTRQVTDPQAPSLTKFVPATELESLTGSVDARSVSKKEMERLKAIDEITQTFLRFVRKTTLQVRCMIEVIHCKSPKHLILGAIDELDPTMAVVGTRGRSSLKGVLLGSFSNYLVTKSSSPVMVARRKPKKPRSHAQTSASKARLSNNLSALRLPRKSLTQARID